MRFFVSPRAPKAHPLLNALGAFLISFWCFTAQAQDSRIAGFVHDFVQDSEGKVKINDIPSILAAPLEYSHRYDSGGMIGLCFWNSNPRYIVLDSEFVRYRSDIEVKALVYHELAHCVGNRYHTRGWLNDFLDWLGVSHKRSARGSDGCPGSLMFPTLPSYSCLDKNWGNYVKELFSGDFHHFRK